MDRALHLLLALLIFVPTVAAGLPAHEAHAPAPDVEGEADRLGAPPAALSEIGVLVLDDPRRSGFASPSLSVGTSIAIQYDAADAAIERYALVERVTTAPNDEVRRGMLYDAIVETKGESVDLREREQQLWAAYANGSIDTETFVSGLATLDASARDLRLYLDEIDEVVDRIAGFSLQRRLQVVDTDLVVFQGPVRDRALAAIRGSATTERVYVEVSDTGVALATVAGDRYLREAYRADSRSADGDTMIFDRAVARTNALYPTASNQSIQLGIGTSTGGNVYRIAFELEDGSLVAYLDGGTGDVFFEVRDRAVSGLAGAEATEAVENDTRIVVNRSFAGGPLRISVSDNETGAPIDATVLVADETVRTGPDGIAWALTPRTERFTVTAIGPGGNVTVFARPLQPEALDAAVRSEG